MNPLTWMYVLGVLTGFNLGLAVMGVVTVSFFRNPRIKVQIRHK